jgi:hypothetical protein
MMATRPPGVIGYATFLAAIEAAGPRGIAAPQWCLIHVPGLTYKIVNHEYREMVARLLVERGRLEILRIPAVPGAGHKFRTVYRSTRYHGEPIQ